MQHPKIGCPVPATMMLAVSLCVLLFLRNDDGSLRDPSESTTAPTASARTATGSPGNTPAAPKPDLRPGNNPNLQPQDRAAPYLCKKTGDERCMASLTGASSVAEAMWLIENGYPEPDKLRELDAQLIPIAQLERNARSGDLIALGMLGRAYNNTGQPERARGVLSEAIGKGSVYAVYELTRTYTSKEYPYANIHTSAAHMRAAYLLGDVKAARYFYETYPSFGSTEFTMADQYGASIYAGLLKMRAENGVNRISSRPMPKD